MALANIQAEPAPVSVDLGRTALLIIDMQRDFLEPGGFGETLGNDVSQLAGVVTTLEVVLPAVRAAGMLVVHTREGHLPDLSDCPPAKLRRGKPSGRIGDPGPYGRILVRGEYGHDIVDQLAPAPGEPVVDKPGKGAFYATELTEILTGITTDVCVHTTMREANDRGLECLILSDCTGATDPGNHAAALHMVTMQGGVFGCVAAAQDVIDATIDATFDATVDPREIPS